MAIEATRTQNITMVQSAFVADRPNSWTGPFILNEVLQWVKFVMVKKYMVGFKNVLRSSWGFGLMNVKAQRRIQFSGLNQGLSINLSKSKLLGVVVSEDRVVQAANRIGCGVLKAPLSLLRVETLKKKSIHLNNFMQKKLGNGADTYFWEDLWHGDMVLKQRYPRLYALEVKKTVDVASKLSHETDHGSFRVRLRKE
ncbi:hypothetical protein Tco_1144207 [Tanacetum coccineum]